MPLWERPEDNYDPLPPPPPTGWEETTILAAGLASLLVFPLVLRVRGPAEKDPLRRTWLRFLKRLERAGYRPRASQGALELAESAAGALPGQASDIRRIGRLYTQCRYSAEPPDGSELRDAVRAFRPKRSDA